MPEDFLLDSHQRIYRAILELQTVGHAVDTITVMDALNRRKELDAIGGPAYLAFLTEGIPRHPNIESYVRIIKDKSLLRQLLGIFNEGMAAAADQAEDATTVLNNVEAKLADVADSAIQRGLSNIPEIVANSFGSIDALYEQGREITGLATHYIEFDKMTSGLQSSELIIIAARPSHGQDRVGHQHRAELRGARRQGRRRLLARNVEGVAAATHARQRGDGRLAQAADRLHPARGPRQADLRTRPPDGARRCSSTTRPASRSPRCAPRHAACSSRRAASTSS